LAGIIGLCFLVSCDRNEAEEKAQHVAWDVLSGFKYDTYEVLNDVDGGRPFTRSDDVIPSHVKGLDGRKIAVTGFIMPLRLKKGLVTEFLLFKDQAACCFGPAAKMNHYVRVKMKTEGFPPSGTLVTYTAYGLLRVGEIKVQGYLTGIYELEAEKVMERKG
jgi:hypothetical protein